MLKKKTISIIVVAILAGSLVACGSQESSETGKSVYSGQVEQTEAVTVKSFGEFDNTAWQYNAEDDVYYQIGITYCANPVDTTYETLAVFVPGAYMNTTENGDGTYTCEINTTAKVGNYTAQTAPIVMPINTPGYSAMAALTGYSSFKEYTNEGFVYIHAGCRGRDHGAPAGVTDLKAAVRYIRYSDEKIPGDAESIFTFGMSGGGAQSALMGSTGDSALYDAYLEEIGALSGVSDAVLGSMCWCPITNLDSADEAYEWMMGTTRSGLSEEEQEISDKLAEAYAEYVNSAGIKDPDGTVLTLSESADGIYQAGSYYDYMKSVIEDSLNNFLSDTTFPYDASSSGSGMTGGSQGQGMPSGGGPDGAAADDSMPDGGFPEKGSGSDSSDVNYEDIDNISRNDTTSSLSLSGTYETAQDYIDALNANGEWVSYDASSNTATITSIEAFVIACKSASKNLGAFDQLDGGQGENTLFGYGDGEGAHFDAYLAEILSEIGNSYASDYASDLAKQDSAGNTVDYRVNMYTPLYFLLESSEGYQTGTVAKYWRIRTGIAQGDCALSTEMNLALALQNYSGVDSVDFETVWGAGHTQAERSGNSTDNFITWVNECMAG